MITITVKVKETDAKITASCQFKRNGKFVTGEETAIARMIYESIIAVKSKTSLEESNE